MTMNPKTRILAVLLFLSLTAQPLVSCGGQKETSEGTSAGNTGSDTGTETEDSRIRADLPEKDFNNATFTFYARIYDGDWSADDLIVHTEDADIINDAVYARTLYIEDTYNVHLELIESGEGELASQVSTLITSGDTSFQAIAASITDMSSLAVQHMLYDLNEVDYIDFSQPWWSQKANNSMSIANKLYYATGDIFIVDNQAIRVVFFNKNMISDFDLESPYTLVQNNEWTIEKMVEYSEVVYGDLNGDNVIKREDDRFGTMAQGSFGKVLYYASGQSITSKDENDLPYLSCNTERAISIMTGISELISNSASISMDDTNTSSGTTWPDNVRYFMDGRVLFAPEVLLFIEYARNCSVDIGIVPPPKYDTATDGYYCFADSDCTNVIAIPVTNESPDDIGFLIEAMAADSLNNLSPAYYEMALTTKYVRDTESVQMLDLILDSMVLENAHIFEWGDMESTLNDAMKKGSAIVSKIERRTAATEKDMQKTIDAFLNEE